MLAQDHTHCQVGGNAVLPAGAGKTTLMDVIAGRGTQGASQGDILVNGHPKDQRTWSRVVGYVEQMDIHSPQVVRTDHAQNHPAQTN